jgi:hypothetical protein
MYVYTYVHVDIVPGLALSEIMSCLLSECGVGGNSEAYGTRIEDDVDFDEICCEHEEGQEMCAMNWCVTRGR